MQAVVWGTWAIIALMLILGVLVFNAFPDYTSQKSWCDPSPNCSLLASAFHCKCFDVLKRRI